MVMGNHERAALRLQEEWNEPAETGLTAVSGRTTNWTRSILSPSRTYRRSHEVTLHPSGLKERTRLDYLICSCNESGGIDARVQGQ